MTAGAASAEPSDDLNRACVRQRFQVLPVQPPCEHLFGGNLDQHRPLSLLLSDSRPLRRSLGQELVDGVGCPRDAGGPMGEVWRDAGIHHADINPAPASRAEENPQNSKDS